MTFQVYAEPTKDIPYYFKDSSELTAEIYEKMAPDVLLCKLPKESGVCGEVERIGKVIPVHHDDTFTCEYKPSAIPADHISVAA